MYSRTGGPLLMVHKSKAAAVPSWACWVHAMLCALHCQGMVEWDSLLAVAQQAGSTRYTSQSGPSLCNDI